jgi:hypothetical protein
MVNWNRRFKTLATMISGPQCATFSYVTTWDKWCHGSCEMKTQKHNWQCNSIHSHLDVTRIGIPNGHKQWNKWGLEWTLLMTHSKLKSGLWRYVGISRIPIFQRLMLPPPSLHPEDKGSTVFWNSGILLHCVTIQKTMTWIIALKTSNLCNTS